MALVHDHIGEFALFSRDRAFSDLLGLPSDFNMNDIDFQHPSTNMDYNPQVAAFSRTNYDPYPITTSFPASSTYLEPHKNSVGSSKVGDEGSIPRPTPSASPSSMSQTLDQPQSALSSTSGASAQSAASSVGGSPYARSAQQIPFHDKWSDPQGLGISSGIGNGEFPVYDHSHQDFVDPALIQHLENTPTGHAPNVAPYPGLTNTFPSISPQIFAPASPVPSDTSSHESHGPSSRHAQSFTGSPYLQRPSFQPYPPNDQSRRVSVTSSHSPNSMESPGSLSFDEEGRERTRCPHPNCGRPYRDLKAHLLTHQSERPEKCPIVSCAYHLKGFSRKYDKNRHTLTHYKGNMVCGFCPGSGSAAEKSFNRADTFKRHLASVHGAEQNPPNGRKKSPTGSNSRGPMSTQDVSGRCSTCSAMFQSAQELYEHLDECLLQVVQQEEPSEAINERILRSVANDENVRLTLDRHTLAMDYEIPHDPGAASDAEGDDDDSNDFNDELGNPSGKSLYPQGLGGQAEGGNPSTKSRRTSGGKGGGMTFSKGGVPLVGKGRRRRKHYPSSWGCSAEQLKMKKRVLCVFDGPRRLWKDEMMLNNEHEVRVPIGDGSSYVTDLDVETMKRVDALHNATKEEKGPWHEEHMNLEEWMA